MCRDIEYIEFLLSNLKTDMQLMKTEECKAYTDSIIKHIERYLKNREEVK